MKNKSKISKIFFILSFLPYMVLLLISLYYAIFGYEVHTFLGAYVRTVYGIAAFLDTLVWNALVLCVIPVLPTVAIYQIIFTIIKIKNKLKQR